MDVVFDEQGHSGTIPAAEVRWSTNMDGSDDHRFIVLSCPDGCGATSTHPVGGGAAPVEVQQMFVKKVEADGCACGSVEAGRTDDVPEAHVHLQVSRMDGPERWQASEVVVDTRAAPGTVKVVYANDTRLIVGEKPNGGVGNDHKLAHITEAEYAKTADHRAAYLAADGDTVGAHRREPGRQCHLGGRRRRRPQP